MKQVGGGKELRTRPDTSYCYVALVICHKQPPPLIFSRWVVWTLALWKSSRAGTQGFLSAVQGRPSWSAAPCMLPTPTWLAPRSTLPITLTPLHTSTLTFPSTISTPTSAWWTTTPEREPCSLGTTDTRSSTTSHSFMSSEVMDRHKDTRKCRNTHKKAESIVKEDTTCGFRVQLSFHAHKTLHSCGQESKLCLCLNVNDCNSSLS